jgi:hypothetical protein
MNNEAPKGSVSKKVSIKNILSVLCIIFLLTTLLFAYLYYSTINDTATNNKENPERVESTNPLPEGDLLNIDELMLSLSKILISEEVRIERGSPLYYLDMFGFPLNYTQSEKLFDFFYEEVIIKEASYHENEHEWFYDTDEWNRFGYGQSTSIYTKSGYACMYDSDFENSFIVCFYAKDLSNNTKENVSLFLENLIKDADLPCQKDECLIQLFEDYPIYFSNYSRSVLYSEKILDDEEFKGEDRIKENAQKISLLFLERKWNSTIEDTTDMEKKWNEDLLIANKVTASNDYLTCDYELKLYNDNLMRHSIECYYHEDALLKYQKEIDSILATN